MRDWGMARIWVLRAISGEAARQLHRTTARRNGATLPPGQDVDDWFEWEERL
jgi:hypothetical protein